MIYMNECEVERATQMHGGHPILGPAVRTLRNLVDWTNENSDGWPYWAKPCRAAAKLQQLIQLADHYNRYRADHHDVTVEEYRAALRPIKAFRTRHSASFEIEEVTA